MSVTAQSLVTTLKDDFGFEYGRPVLLDYLRRTVNSLCNQNAEQMTYLNGSDVAFPFPVLVTEDETLDYEVSNTNLVDSEGTAITMTVGGYPVVCRKINHVFLAGGSFVYGGYDRVSITGTSAYWAQRLSNVAFYKVPGSIYDRTNLKAAHFQFHSNPGAHTDRYYVEFYWGALELSSESIPLSLDGDMWEEALIEGTVGLIEKVENGQSNQLDHFRSYWLPLFVKSMNASMEERSPLQMPIRRAG